MDLDLAACAHIYLQILEHAKEFIEFNREKSGISVRGLDIPGKTKNSNSKELL